MKEGNYLVTYSKNKVSTNISLIMCSSQTCFPSGSRAPVHHLIITASIPIFLLVRVSALSYTLKAINFPQDKELVGSVRLRF